MASPETKVYRLRGIPAHLDRLGVTQLIQAFLPNGKLEDITVASLAMSCEFWIRNPTKIATLTLRKLPEVVRIAPAAGEWQLPVLALPKPLILDDKFYGLTPLNEVKESHHQFDCVVISGLASHPMGSWQPRGNDKSFMWIRDKLPELVPNVRFILYGYDTTLVGSNSFQTVADLANNLINELKAGGWSSPSSKELAFLAHSLGGVVLKQLFCMLADSDVSSECILQKTKGAIFFGTPSEGMDIEDIHTMLKDQPNKDALVAEISNRSSFLSSLEERISGIVQLRAMKLNWAYETQKTPTVKLVDGAYGRSGSGTILVSRESATGNRCTSDAASTIQINENHSNMVKFSPGNHIIGPIANTLRNILQNDQGALSQYPERLATLNLPKIPSNIITLANHSSRDIWDLESTIQSLRVHERDERLQQIDESAGCSFEWAFDDSSIGLKKWLQKGDGLYWVSGRPASGKSTFMKFLYHDKRTSQLLHGWYSKAAHVEANFFFHYRGNLIQKSFEGLLRSILSQVLEQAPSTFSLVQAIIQHASQNVPKRREPVTQKKTERVESVIDEHHDRENIQHFANEIWTLPNLQKVLHQVIDQQSMDLDLCIFIDALDEHDGPPEFIAEFLKDIIQPRNSRTRVKILFSSRPWDVFKDVFPDCPGFQIHQHTDNDIRELCTHVINSECPASQELFQLVEEIVKRAKGVFLWVKLVLQELSKIAASAPLGRNTEALSGELRVALQNLPDDLVEYFSTIVERIPQSFRREAFCLLEVVAKGDGVYLADVPKILGCLNFSHYSELEQILENLDERTPEQWATLLRTYTGGLIEIQKPPKCKLQLLHQTTVDFVQLPEFKNIVLRSGAHATSDNGHTFLVKLILLKPLEDEYGDYGAKLDLLFHANYSEKTTGRSLYSFFSDVSTFEARGIYSSCISGGLLPSHLKFTSPFQLAFNAHLRLFIEDALQSESSFISKSTNCWAQFVFDALYDGLATYEEALQMIELLATHGSSR
ncbi:uncharacterized protein Triagg1_3999 [Trichoderma aggressivum f. europaeum]|uniref:Nephrocystin 3-like N-terminal domain-containing protein n=1 Tax=Trichoderma aggressivum f. europaeum TaxID=173218 RepID=A0AAE1J8N9_9HYPO|nr:hypothetical protein Triagg1_3999 [Trichoderma aggressivum f. europaeum]